MEMDLRFNMECVSLNVYSRPINSEGNHFELGDGRDFITKPPEIRLLIQSPTVVEH